jgi:hypothetical protein
VERRPNGRVWSELLQLEIGVDEDRNLRLYAQEGEPLLYYLEAEQARVEAEHRAEQWAEERAAAERRAEQLAQERSQAEQEREREAQARAEAEHARAEAERLAAAERERRETLERQLAELQARLEHDQEAP